jgi:hypothetical protein
MSDLAPLVDRYGAARRVDWSCLLDGQPRRVPLSAQRDGIVDQLRSTAHRQAAYRGLRATCKLRHDDPDHLLVQFIARPAETPPVCACDDHQLINRLLTQKGMATRVRLAAADRLAQLVECGTPSTGSGECAGQLNIIDLTESNRP